MVLRSARYGSRNYTAGAQLIQTICSVYNRCAIVEITLKTTNEIESNWIKCYVNESIERTNYETSDNEMRTKRIDTGRNESEANVHDSKRQIYTTLNDLNLTTATTLFIRLFYLRWTACYCDGVSRRPDYRALARKLRKASVVARTYGIGTTPRKTKQRSLKSLQTTYLCCSTAIFTPKVQLTFNKFEKPNMKTLILFIFFLIPQAYIAQKLYGLCEI